MRSWMPVHHQTNCEKQLWNRFSFRDALQTFRGGVSHRSAGRRMEKAGRPIRTTTSCVKAVNVQIQTAGSQRHRTARGYSWGAPGRAWKTEALSQTNDCGNEHLQANMNGLRGKLGINGPHDSFHDKILLPVLFLFSFFSLGFSFKLGFDWGRLWGAGDISGIRMQNVQCEIHKEPIKVKKNAGWKKKLPLTLCPPKKTAEYWDNPTWWRVNTFTKKDKMYYQSNIHRTHLWL